jgi:hypothetical protein
MPLVRYFSVVGAALLALLFVCNAFLAKAPVADGTEGPVVDKTVIRIHSDRKWPERVVFDTSLPTIVPPPTVTAALPAPAAQGEAAVPPPPKFADDSTKTRQAFAQLRSGDANHSASSDLKRSQQLQRKRRIARRHVAPPMMLVEQQPRYGFGFFGNNIW